MDRTALTRLLVLKRGQLDPAKLGFSKKTTRGPQVTGATQYQVNHALGRSDRTYGKIEGGSLDPTPELFEEIARLLEFSEKDWRAGWNYLFEGEPPYPLDPSAALTVAPNWRDALHVIGTPAYVNDPSWNVLAHNRAFEDVFLPGDMPTNTMRWMILDQNARKRYLGDWTNSWAVYVIPQLRAAAARHPANEVLGQLASDVLADDVAGPIYRTCPDAYTDPDGDVRPFWHAGRGSWMKVTMCASTPLVSPGQLLMLLLFREETHGPFRTM